MFTYQTEKKKKRGQPTYTKIYLLHNGCYVLSFVLCLVWKTGRWQIHEKQTPITSQG